MMFRLAADIKRLILVTAVFVIVFGCFVSCKNVGRDAHIAPPETTAVIDDETGETRRYETVSENGTAAFAEIATDKNGEPITAASGEYAAEKETETVTQTPDTVGETETEQSATTTSEPATDPDGWINRWY